MKAFDRYDTNPTKAHGKMNDITVNLYIDHTQYFGKQMKSYMGSQTLDLEGVWKLWNATLQTIEDSSLYYFPTTVGCFLAFSINEELIPF